MMNPNVYRWCAVPQCKNTSIKTPNKLFINVSTNKNVRNMWLKMARRDTASVYSNSVIYFCEDHFDLPNDMENYMEYHIMGSVSKVRMKSGCVPTRFECQPDRRKRAFSTTERQFVHKKQRKLIIEEIENSVEMENKPTTSLETVKSSVIHTTKEQEQSSTTCPKFIDKASHVHRVSLPEKVVRSTLKRQRTRKWSNSTVTQTELVQDPNSLLDEESSTTGEEEVEENIVPITKPFIRRKQRKAKRVRADNIGDIADNLSMYSGDEEQSSSSCNIECNNDEMLHEGFICDACKCEIKGFRYTCVQCSDLDLCSACELDRAHHHHYVLRVPEPRPYAEIQFVLATIRRYLMQKLDPITQFEQDDDTISVKSEIKSEHEDDELSETAAARDDSPTLHQRLHSVDGDSAIDNIAIDKQEGTQRNTQEEKQNVTRCTEAASLSFAVQHKQQPVSVSVQHQQQPDSLAVQYQQQPVGVAVQRKQQLVSVAVLHKQQPVSVAAQHKQQPVSDAVQHKQQPVSDAVQHKQQPVSVAVQHKQQPVSVAVQHKQQPVGANVQHKQQPIRVALQNKQQPISVSVQHQQQPVNVAVQVKQEPVGVAIQHKEQLVRVAARHKQQPLSVAVQHKQQPVSANVQHKQQPVDIPTATGIHITSKNNNIIIDFNDALKVKNSATTAKKIQILPFPKAESNTNTKVAITKATAAPQRPGGKLVLVKSPSGMLLKDGRKVPVQIMLARKDTSSNAAEENVL